VYIAELLDVSNTELTLLYVEMNIGIIVYHRHFPDEHRLLVAFDAAEGKSLVIQQLTLQL